MIDERRIAKSFGSFWRVATPTMELFVRRCNLELYTRNFPSLDSATDPARRALINLLAYELFHVVFAEVAKLPPIKRAKARSLGSLMATFANDELFRLACLAMQIDPTDIGSDERAEVGQLGYRMASIFSAPVVPFKTKPQFLGCGVLLSCVGDALIEPSTIVEFKDGDRPFRAYEFRQLALYASLYFNEHRTIPESLMVVNSRRGVSVEISTERFADEVAGQSASSLLHEIAKMLSDSTISQ